MIYTAKKVYKEKLIAKIYDSDRFKSWRGRTVDRLEKERIVKAITKLTTQVTFMPLILDAPSGTGRLAEELLQYQYRVVAIDISLEMIKQGEEKRNLRRLPNFLGYVCADLEHLPFRDECIDIVCSLRIVGHLPQEVKAQVLKEFRRVSRIWAVVMFAMVNLRLRLKRWLIYFLRLKPKPRMWFPLSHSKIVSLAFANKWSILTAQDLVKWISESRLYIFRPLD